MKQREKNLLLTVGVVVALFSGVFVVRSVFAKPLKSLKDKTDVLLATLDHLDKERRACAVAEDYLKGLAPRVFGRDADTATAAAGKMLTDQIVLLGLQEAQFSRMPVGPRKMGGAQEVGWSVQGEGPLSKVVDLLFVLEQTPQVHRLENLALSAGERPGWVRVRFRYLTLIIEVAGQTPKADLKPNFALDSPQRRAYDGIVMRDLLRPYIPKPAAPDPPPSGQGSPLDALRVVSLSEWQGLAEVHVCDQGSMKISSFKAGDTLAGGQVVMIDYRTLPMPGQPGLFSNSRVVLKIGTNYWAVEHGQTLSTQYQIAPEQLPAQLKRP